MTAVATVTARAPRPLRGGTDAPARRLRPVGAVVPRRRPRLMYGLVALAGALSIAGAQMVLSILTTQTSYELAGLTQQQRVLSWQKQILHDDVAGLSSPQYLAANAAALGMVIDEYPSYLRLSDAAVLGTGDPSLGVSSVDAIGRGAVPNSLVADTPLVTLPDATIQGIPVAPVEVATGPSDPDTPPPPADGLPTPRTH